MHIDRYMNSASNLILYTVLLALSPSSSPSGARILWVSSIDSLPRRQLHGPVPLSPPFAGKQAKLLMHGMAPHRRSRHFSFRHTRHTLLTNKLHSVYDGVSHTHTQCVCVLYCQWEVDSADVVGAGKESVWRSVSPWINQSIISICLITSLPLNGMKEGAATGARGFCLCTQDTEGSFAFAVAAASRALAQEQPPPDAFYHRVWNTPYHCASPSIHPHFYSVHPSIRGLACCL